MKKSTAILVVLLFIAAAFAAYRIGFGTTGAVVGGSNEYDAFAQCLTEKGAVFYGAYWCPHCQKQKEMFGSSFKFVKYIECSLPNKAGQTEECKVAGIKAYPTWDIKGVRREGELSLQQLAELTGCQLL
jgi:hypothetical protein